MSQKSKILEALKRGETITPLDALNRFGCFRLGAQIFDLKAEGHDIENIGLGHTKYGRYRLRQQQSKIVLPPAYKPKPKEPNRLL